MDDALRRELWHEQSTAAIDALVAVERAVAEGRLNAAKVLRARALACQRRAMILAATGSESVDVAEAVRTAVAANRAAISTLTDGTDGSPAVQAAVDSLESELALLERTAAALQTQRDVGEDEIAQFVWVCDECGYMVETARPEICPCCGAIAGEFVMFAPFFASTPEHTGRLAPDAIKDGLAAVPAELRATLAGATDEALAKKPAASEWCAKEIAGHMVDIAELAERRLALAFEAGAAEARERSALPWRLLDFEDYPSQEAPAIADRFEEACAALAARFGRLTAGQWRTRVDLGTGRTLAVDVGSWVVNHNRAHLEQVRARLAE